MFKKNIQRVDKVDTVVGQGTIFDGNIQATGIVRIDGKLKGSVQTSGEVIVGEKGEVYADVSAGGVTVAGKVYGNIVAKEKTNVLNTGYVEGDIDTKAMIIEDGAIFKGKCIMGDNTKNITPKTPLLEEKNDDSNNYNKSSNYKKR